MSLLTSVATEEKNDWLVWQLADSAFPTGAFAHSAGLEAAWQHGEVRNRTELLSFLEASLNQLGHAALPFVTAAHAEPARLAEFDHLCDAFTSNHVANRASRLQGRAFLSAVDRVFTLAAHGSAETRAKVRQASRLPIREESRSIRVLGETGKMCALPYVHFAPVFGAATRYLGLPQETATRLFFFSHLRGQVAASVRLNIIGPMEAQALQRRLSSLAEEIRKRCEPLTLDDLAQTASLLDLWHGAQDRLDSRLFQS